MKLQDLPDVCTTKEIMAVLPLGKDSIYRLLQTREIPNIRTGNKYLVPKKAFLKRLNQPSTVHISIVAS